MCCNLGNIVNPGSLRGPVWRKKDGGALRRGRSVNDALSSDNFCQIIHCNKLVEVLFGSECTTQQTGHTRELEGNVLFLQIALLAKLR